ncbi:hypothetical protein ACFFTM_08470 [Pseudoduganella plicata]|uniref:Uncharacterized protein n=1 Tax=Pseudoduganella plicata TaxID=321984 RepID=A0A4P7BBG5_9BURK|nr:hypothetical protein [Pseudoduganella plicata]QBQ35480.1 hypothetical protein E1742_04345 [Pseudoduganella plicata]GGZ02099.1 hypothetical protein GCM10007388_39850 [Pseudoduganella plicata]
MHELISQLVRLYLPLDIPPQAGLAEHLEGQATRLFDLGRDGAVRAIVLPFDGRAHGSGTAAWERLCEVANVLQAELGLPAPAVSIDGATGYRLWLSFGQSVDVATAQRFVDLLCAAYCPEVVLPAGGVLAPVELPPCRNGTTGKWAAFVHPGMGASFADEPALEMTPPAAAQAAFLQGLERIDAAQLRHALDVLAGDGGQPEAQPAPGPGSRGLLLQDATLEDIVRHLHARNIEPTFRYLMPSR